MMNWIAGVGRSTLSQLLIWAAHVDPNEAILVDQTSVFTGV